MNAKLFNAILGLTIVVLLVSACGVIPEAGSRNLISETRTVSGFDRVTLSGGGSLEIIQDGTESLTVETDDNVMQYVTSDVKGKTLELGLDFNGLRSIIPSRLHFTLHVKNLTGIATSGSWDVTTASLETGSLNIATSGSGDVRIDALTADTLTVDVSGTSKQDLTGTVKQQSVTISGSGTYLAGDLKSQSATVDISGSGNVTVWAVETLNASISGSGDIKYYGKPQVTFNESGSGHIQSLGDK